MPTPDEIETLIEAARDAAIAVNAAGETSGITATSGREYIIVPFVGEHAQHRLASALERNSPPIRPGLADRADGIVYVAEDDAEVLCVVRCKK